jgi:hypothetical protein
MPQSLLECDIILGEAISLGLQETGDDLITLTGDPIIRRSLL